MQMRCPRHGTFMKRLTPDSHYYWCLYKGCKEIRDDRPDHNFGLMLLGFTSTAQRP
jgi:hypothetical protein